MDKPSDILERALLSGRWKRAKHGFLRFNRTGDTFLSRKGEILFKRYCPLEMLKIEHSGGSASNDYRNYARKHFDMSGTQIEAVIYNADHKPFNDPVAHLRSLGF